MRKFQLLIVVACGATLGLGQSDWTLDATSGRPMLDAVRSLRDGLGWVISYEEGVYDISHLRRDGPTAVAPGAPRMLFRIRQSRLANVQSFSPQERAGIVRDIADQYSQLDDMRFRVTTDGRHVLPAIPTPSRGALPGAGDSYKSPLDTPVTMQPADTYPHMGAAIESVVAQAAAASGLSIAVGMMPYNIVLRKKLLFDVPEGSTARTALEHILLEVHIPSGPSNGINSLTWELLYDGNSRGFFFNVVSVPNSARPARVITDQTAPATPNNGTGSRALGRP